MAYPDNRRWAPRVPVDLPVQVATFSSKPFIEASLIDLNRKGIAVETDCVPQPDEELEVIISVPYEISLQKFISVRFRGQVVRVLADSQGNHEGFAARLMPVSAHA